MDLEDFKLIQTHWNFIWSKQDLSKLKIFEMKYGCEWFVKRNNFLHSNLSRFEMDFK
jgi:hypothetical protein